MVWDEFNSVINMKKLFRLKIYLKHGRSSSEEKEKRKEYSDSNFSLWSIS